MFFKKLLSIDIGTKNIKLVVGFEKKNIINIKTAVSIPTPMNAYDDGEILSMEDLKNCIKESLKENKIKTKNCVITLESTSTITREIVVPLVKKEELNNMVIMEIEQYLPIVLDEYIIEYRIIEEFEENEVKKLRVLVVALSKKIVKTYLELIKEMKLIPEALDMHANSISKLFGTDKSINHENYSLKETVAVIDFGNSYINVKIIDKGSLRFNRIIPQGGKDIDMSIADGYNLSIEQAEKKKMEDVKLSNNSDFGDSMLKELVKSNIDSWILEIQRIFRYYTSRNTLNQIDKIYIHGGNSNINDIISYIVDNLNIPTFKIENMSNLRYKKGCDNIDLDKYLNAIGAIIRR